nr:YhfG family protein [Halopseudomonas salegens]
MTVATQEAKQAYFAKMRRKNYLASLRLEGFDVSDQKVANKLSTKADVIAAHMRKASA